jgi:ubiquinone/menaquinone biosynthesis C-methylase UbiE
MAGGFAVPDERHNFPDVRQGVKLPRSGILAGRLGIDPAPSKETEIPMQPTQTSTTAPASPDFDAIKKRQQAAWASADFGRIGIQLQIVGESLCEAVDLRAGEQVLDVAAGNGNASLAAARRYGNVTSTDYVPDFLQDGLRRAQAEGLPMEIQVADAENLPFPDASFDLVLSTFGVMFAPHQVRAATEMLRVVKPGGRIGLANWTPDGFAGELFRLIGGFVPPASGLKSPSAWGTETRITELFGPSAADIRTQRKPYVFRYRSAEHWIEVFRGNYGPVGKAFAAQTPDKQQELHAALVALLKRFDRGDGTALIVPSDYLEVVVTKAGRGHA